MIDKDVRRIVADIVYRLEGLGATAESLSTRIRHLADDICDSCTATFQYDQTRPRPDTRLCRPCLESSLVSLEERAETLEDQVEQLRHTLAEMRAGGGR